MSIRLILVCLTVLIFAANPSSGTASEPLVISQIEGNNIIVRIGRAVATKLYASASIPVVFEDYPGKRSVANANNGVTDGELLRSRRASQMYPNLVRVDVPVVTDELAAYTINVEGAIKSPGALGKFVIGFRRGSTIPTKLTEGMSRIQINSFAQGVQLLEQGRIDILLYFRMAATIMLRENFPDSKIRRISDRLIEVPLYHYLHKRNKHLVPIFETKLRQLISSGEHKKIVATVNLDTGN